MRPFTLNPRKGLDGVKKDIASRLASPKEQSQISVSGKNPGRASAMQNYIERSKPLGN